MSFFRRHGDDFPYLEPEPEPVEKPSRRGLSQELLVGIAFGVTFIVGLTCGLAVVVPALRPSPSPTQQAEAVPDYSVPTAREAYVPAVELIRQTDPTAELASGAGTWTPVIDPTGLEAGRTGWTFFFFLPATGEMASVVVGQNGQARLSGISQWETPPSLMGDQQWRTDSPQVMAYLLQACGGALGEMPGAQVEARLTTAAENRTLLWQARVYSPDDPLAVCEVTVDGITGLLR